MERELFPSFPASRKQILRAIEGLVGDPISDRTWARWKKIALIPGAKRAYSERDVWKMLFVASRMPIHQNASLVRELLVDELKRRSKEQWNT